MEEATICNGNWVESKQHADDLAGLNRGSTEKEMETSATTQ
jgi:hypothetical protein